MTMKATGSTVVTSIPHSTYCGGFIVSEPVMEAKCPDCGKKYWSDETATDAMKNGCHGCGELNVERM